MKQRNIIVIGASSGGFEALKILVGGFPRELKASVFIVWHMAPDIQSVLPVMLNKLETLPADYAHDYEQIRPNRIYIAPPDRHMLVGKDKLRITKGPKENRFRPAIDPLFRSAALAFGEHVIGLILSGALDDGTAGLWTVKNAGGVAVVQDPEDAEVASMPQSAMRRVAVDHCVRVDQMAALLTRIVEEEVPEKKEIEMKDEEKTKLEVSIAREDPGSGFSLFKMGELTPYTCPECNGVLSALREGGRVRFRCHTGHAFSTDTLLTSLTENIEESIWNAIRGVQESVILLNHIGDHFAEDNLPKIAALYFQKAKEAEDRETMLRRTVSSHEQLSEESIRREAQAK